MRHPLLSPKPFGPWGAGNPMPILGTEPSVLGVWLCPQSPAWRRTGQIPAFNSRGNRAEEAHPWDAAIDGFGDGCS